MSEVALFDGFEPGPEPATLSAGRRLTLRQRADVDAGRHPLTRGPLAASGTCGTCVHRTHNYRSYPKCDLGPVSRGPATDVRAWWPACERHETGDT